jgi:hypothetical protein
MSKKVEESMNYEEIEEKLFSLVGKTRKADFSSDFTDNVMQQIYELKKEDEKKATVIPFKKSISFVTITAIAASFIFSIFSINESISTENILLAEVPDSYYWAFSNSEDSDLEVLIGESREEI